MGALIQAVPTLRLGQRAKLMRCSLLAVALPPPRSRYVPGLFELRKDVWDSNPTWASFSAPYFAIAAAFQRGTRTPVPAGTLRHEQAQPAS